MSGEDDPTSEALLRLLDQALNTAGTEKGRQRALADANLVRAEVFRLREFEAFMREQAEKFGGAASLRGSLAEWDGAVS